MTTPLPSLSWLPDPIEDGPAAHKRRAGWRVGIWIALTAALGVAWYALMHDPRAAFVLAALMPLAAAGAWANRAWLVHLWAARWLPQAALDGRVHALLGAHSAVWLPAASGMGGAPCVARWRWTAKGLVLERCTVLSPHLGGPSARTALPVGLKGALVPHRAGIFGLGNRLCVATRTAHSGLVVLEWTTAHSRLALLHALGAKTYGEDSQTPTTRQQGARPDVAAPTHTTGAGAGP